MGQAACSPQPVSRKAGYDLPVLFMNADFVHIPVADKITGCLMNCVPFSCIMKLRRYLYTELHSGSCTKLFILSMNHMMTDGKVGFCLEPSGLRQKDLVPGICVYMKP
jgi:hypothetical protein